VIKVTPFSCFGSFDVKKTSCTSKSTCAHQGVGSEDVVGIPSFQPPLSSDVCFHRTKMLEDPRERERERQQRERGGGREGGEQSLLADESRLSAWWTGRQAGRQVGDWVVIHLSGTKELRQLFFRVEPTKDAKVPLSPR
jgi:hypothetical protein